MTADAVWCRRYCYIYYDTICKFFALLCVSIWYYDFTTNGEGEHGAATARRKLEPDGGSPNKYEHGKRKPLGAGSTRRQEMGRCGDRPRRDGGTEKRLKRRPKRKAHRSDGGRADQQGPRLRHKDRAVKRDEIRIFTSGRSVDFLTIHRPA